MSTLSSIQPAQAGTAPHFDASDWRAILVRFVAAWKARQQARAQRRLDGYFRRERNEHERFLSNATDHYEVERLERAWERRHVDLWRVY
jgi:hypothetical protein